MAPALAEPRRLLAIAERLRWDAAAIDLRADARAWGALTASRRARLRALLAGFVVAEDAVAEELEPFVGAAGSADVAAAFEAQRRDEWRHARFFDRVADEVLGLPGASVAARRAAARTLAPPAVAELFEVRLPAVARALATGTAGLADGVGLYHLVLEGVVFGAGQQALLDDLSDGALPGVREGVRRVELDERWHVGLGLRCLAEARPSPARVAAMLAAARDAAAAWGDAVPADARERALRLTARRLGVAGLRPGAAV